MNLLIIPFFISLFVSEYFARQLGVIPGYLALLPELFSAVVFLVVFARLLAGKGCALDIRYGIFLGLYLFVLVFGFVLQSMTPGAIVSGLRNYLKFVPFFLLPLFFPPTLRQLKVQLIALVVILAVQTPLAFYQRFVQYAHAMHTGDPVRGMSTSSGILTILMMCAIAAVVSLYLRRKLNFAVMVVTIGILFLPTTINETKSTVFLLPTALFLPALLMPRGSGALRRLAPLAIVGSLGALAFVSMYNQLAQHRGSAYTIQDFFKSGRFDNYLYTGAAEGEETWIGRFDSMMIAAEHLSQNPADLAFGMGAGNVSKSSLPGFSGRYSSYYEIYGVGVTQVSAFLWEIGVLGILTYMLFYAFAWRDARYVARYGGEFAVVGQAWGTIVVIMALCFGYQTVFWVNETGYLFWLYSGVVASLAASARKARKEKSRRDLRERWPGKLGASSPQPAAAHQAAR